LFAGGRIVDGTGAPWFRGDVYVIGDKIATVGKLADRSARRRIDAAKLVVMSWAEERALLRRELVRLSAERTAAERLVRLTDELDWTELELVKKFADATELEPRRLTTHLWVARNHPGRLAGTDGGDAGRRQR
jgi:hypothetical protein